MSRTAQTERQDITIDSNWVITIGLALLFAFIAFLLGWSIRDLLFDKVSSRTSPGVNSGWPDALTYAIGVINYFAFAYSFRAKELKLAFSLLAINYTLRLALFYIHASTEVHHFLGIAGTIARQIAYLIILFAIAQWFKTVIRRAPLSSREVSHS